MSLYPLEEIAPFLVKGPKNKAQRLLLLSFWIIRLEVQKPGLKWTVTELAKNTKTSRAWIYEILGRNQKMMLSFALEHALGEFYGDNEDRQALAQQKGAIATLFRSRRVFETFPELLVFYYRNRGTKNHFGRLIQNRENAYLEKLATQSGLKGKPLKRLRTRVHGLVTAFFLSDEDVAIFFKEELGPGADEPSPQIRWSPRST